MKTAAIFDLDGTLLVAPSAEWLFVRYLIGHRQIGMGNLWGWIRNFYTEPPSQWSVVLRRNKGYLAGMDRTAVLAMARHCFSSQLVSRIGAGAVAAIAQHKAQGHLIGILSGSPDFMVELFRQYLDLDFACGTRLEVNGPHYTGRIIEPHPYAEGKVTVLSQLLQSYHIDPAHSYGYANTFGDRLFLQVLGHPVAVNPDRRLQRYAQLRGWEIQLVG